jgi:hypothetical protein
VNRASIKLKSEPGFEAPDRAEKIEPGFYIGIQADRQYGAAGSNALRGFVAIARL